MARAALLLLADGRFPGGAHAHSSGIEAAHRAGYVSDLTALDDYIRGRLTTTGSVEAAFTARAATGRESRRLLDEALDVRMLSPRLRGVSRTLGRQLIRAARQVWPSAELDELWEGVSQGLHQPIALGAAAAGAGLSPNEAAVCGLYQFASGLATAALRLLGLDPFRIAALLASLDPLIDQIAASAAASVDAPLDTLPALGSPLVDILAEDHANWEVRLFAS